MIMPGTPPQLPPPGGRGRGGRRAAEPKAAAPCISLATLSLQLANMAATAAERAEHMEARLGALEVARAAPPLPGAPLGNMGVAPQLATAPGQMWAPPQLPPRPPLAVVGALPT